MKKKRIKMGDIAQVKKSGDFYFNYIGKITDRYTGDGHILFCVRFGHGLSGWYKPSELAAVPVATR